jgi:hypothetical protein
MKYIFAVLLVLFSPVFSQAKRMAPEEVEPLIYKGIKFVAPTQKMGYIEAWDIETKKKVWEKKVYTVIYNPLLETDVQDIFIVSLQIKDGKLLVIDEHHRRFKEVIPKEILREKNN